MLGTLGRASDALQAGNIGEAEFLLKLVLTNDKNNFDALHTLGLIEGQRGNFAQALHHLIAAVRARPNFPDALVNLGRVQFHLGDQKHAVASYEKALKLAPDHALAHSNFSCVLRHQGRLDEALSHCDRAVQIDGRFADAWDNRGNILCDLGRLDEALTSYEKALSINPNLSSAASQRIHIKSLLCDWHDFQRHCDYLIATVRSGASRVAPFTFLAVPATPEDQSKCARTFHAQNYSSAVEPLWKGARYAHDRVRIGYLSADFHNHPTAHLLAGVVEQHNRQRFETIAVSYGVDDGSELRSRLCAGFERFVDVRDESDAHVARLMHQLEIDIAVDLKGYTSGCRPAILAMRPAPIQVNYLGFPGTMGAPYIDYIIADRVVIPENQYQWYSEKIVSLPDSYQVNDDKRVVADKAFTRTEMGLPATGFVYACFNNSYKITPHIFDCWMRLLQQVEGSVLWLFEANATAASNLRKEASARGVGPRRLIFAKRMPLPEHLARHRLADLFLDTLPYNAHTTASDALWAGLPVLTRLGGTFAGRVAASLLHAINLPELITTSLDDYQALAVALARKPAQLAAIKHKLAENRLAAPLFDTKRFTRSIEAAYCAMHERHVTGLGPDHIVIANS